MCTCGDRQMSIHEDRQMCTHGVNSGLPVMLEVTFNGSWILLWLFDHSELSHPMEENSRMIIC